MKTHCIDCSIKFDEPSPTRKYCSLCAAIRKEISSKKRTITRRKQRQQSKNELSIYTPKKQAFHIDEKFLKRGLDHKLFTSNGMTMFNQT